MPWARRQAATYYFLSLVLHDRSDQAQLVLASLTGAGALDLPKPAVAALEKAGRSQELFAFLKSLLVAHPEVPAWEVFIEEGAFTGHSADALATLNAVLARPGLPVYLRSELAKRHADALLATDDSTHALAELAALIHEAPTTNDPFL